MGDAADAATEIIPLTPSQRQVVLPTLAVRIALGAQVSLKEPLSEVLFDREAFRMHREDAELASAAAKELAENFNLERELRRRRLNANDVLHLADEARKIVDRHVLGLGDLKRLVYVPSLSQASAAYRCTTPATLAMRSGEIVAHWTHTRTVGELMRYDAVIVQMDAAPVTRKVVRHLKERAGKRVGFEIDDAFDALDPSHPDHAMMDEQEQAAIREMLSMADLVLTASEALRGRLMRHTSAPVRVLPNLLPLSEWPRTRTAKDTPPRIVWAGSPQRGDDFARVRGALLTLLDERPALQVLFLGLEEPPVAHERAKAVEWVPFERYADMLAATGARVGICPLAPTEFNRCKSPVKAAEYAASGIAVCASALEPYSAVVEHGRTGRLCATEEDWLKSLRRLLDDEPYRDALAREAYLRIARRFDAGSRENMELVTRTLSEIFG